MKLPESGNQRLFKDEKTGVEVWIKRLDIRFPESMGNKYYKLKYNLEIARAKGFDRLLTFGGAFSNHIAATASLGKSEGFQTIGIIRGEELEAKLGENPTLLKAVRNGMRLVFVSRADYRLKHENFYSEKLQKEFGPIYILPEGGTNELAVKGCCEILHRADAHFDYICVPVGTGGTLSGIVNSLAPGQKAVGFSALKYAMKKEVSEWVSSEDYEIFPDLFFGGFAKINRELPGFINRFKADYGILLDPVYTAKMMYSMMRRIREGYFQKNSRILAIHTGGLQGVDGMNLRLKKKGFPVINK